jgi:flagellar FliL protein
MATKTAEADPKTDEAKGGGKKKLLLIAVPVLLLAAAAAWLLLLRGGGEAEAEPQPEPGTVLRLDSITINLAGGHFLKLGLGLQQDAAASSHSEPDGAIALDLAIDQFSQMTITELSTAEGRNTAKQHLLEKIEEAYHHLFYDVYFTEFVMQ